MIASMSTSTEAPVTTALDHITQAEKVISEALRPVLTQLQQQTGLTPSDIDVEMLDVRTAGKRPEYVLGHVRLRF